MTTLIDIAPHCTKLMKFGLPEKQAIALTEVIVDISNEIELDKEPRVLQSCDPPKKSFWIEMIKTIFWTWFISSIFVALLAFEIIGIKHIRFT